MEAAMDQLNQATAWVMRASVATAALVLLVLLVQWVFGKYLPARWRYALWLLVLVRLALPVVPSSPLSVWNLSRNWHEALMPSESSTIVSRSAAVAAADGVAEAGPRPTPANRGVSSENGTGRAVAAHSGLARISDGAGQLSSFVASEPTETRCQRVRAESA